jgi:DNA-binding LacI/PurR family transcriptional regulator
MVSCWADGADCVATDDDLGLYLAVEHLAGLGHERIAHAVDPIMEASTRTARAQAFARAMRDHGLSARAGWTVALDESEHDDAALAPVLAAASPPTAFVADSDYRAIHLIELLERRGLDVPDDISIVGFDGIAIGALSRLALSTVAQPINELASQAVGLLVDRVERGDGGPPVQRRLRPALVPRRSTAPPGRP